MNILTIDQKYNVGNEEIMAFGDRLKSEPFLLRAAIRILGGMFFTLPAITYDWSDVNKDKLKKLQANEKEIKIIDDWILNTDYALLEEFKAMRAGLMKHIAMPSTPRLYRGFSVGSEQQKNGMSFGRKWYGKQFTNHQVGDEIEFAPENLMSFTTNEPTAKQFGTVVVSVDTKELVDRCLYINTDLLTAVYSLQDNYEQKKWFSTYDEVVFIPDGKPLKFTIEQIKL